MGDVQGTGTEGSVFVGLIGSIGNTERIILRESDDSRIKFAKGKSYKFTIETADIGLVGVFENFSFDQGRINAHSTGGGTNFPRGGSRRPSQTYEDLALLKIYMITDE